MTARGECDLTCGQSRTGSRPGIASACRSRQARTARYVRNPGTGEDPLEAETQRPVEVELLYGPERPSLLVLPIAGTAVR